MLIAIALFDGFTVLDAVGPYHTVAHTPGYEFAFVAERAGMVGNGGSFSMVAHRSIDDVDAVDVLIVPGGLAAVTMAETGGPLVDWIRAVHPTTTWTTSVCTGSLLLGAAGVLEGKRATSHWTTFPVLEDFGAIPVNQRVVKDGNILTGAGVSAGLDFAIALTEQLRGRDYAAALVLQAEYAPEPPIRAGSVEAASAPVGNMMSQMFAPVAEQFRALAKG